MVKTFVKNGVKTSFAGSCTRAIWKSLHRHLGISIGTDVGNGIGITKNLFCLAKSLFLQFEVLYEENIHGVSGDVYSSYSVENPLTPASEKRNSTVDVISGVLKTRKA